MNIEILHQPDSTIAKLDLAPRESVTTEAGSMVAMSGSMQVDTTLRQGSSGLLGGLKRMMTGESLFLSVFQAGDRPAELFLAPKLIGDICVYPLQGNTLVVQSTGYLANTPGVDIDIGFPGLKTLFSGESLFWLTLSGSGTALISSFGGIYDIDVDGEYIVDTGHIVAFERTLDFSITKAGAGWIGSFLGGEGLVCQFRGRGKVYCQTHSPGSFGHLLGPRLPAR